MFFILRSTVISFNCQNLLTIQSIKRLVFPDLYQIVKNSRSIQVCFFPLLKIDLVMMAYKDSWAHVSFGLVANLRIRDECCSLCQKSSSSTFTDSILTQPRRVFEGHSLVAGAQTALNKVDHSPDSWPYRLHHNPLSFYNCLV